MARTAAALRIRQRDFDRNLRVADLNSPGSEHRLSFSLRIHSLKRGVRKIERDGPRLSGGNLGPLKAHETTNGIAGLRLRDRRKHSHNARE